MLDVYYKLKNKVIVGASFYFVNFTEQIVVS